MKSVKITLTDEQVLAGPEACTSHLYEAIVKVFAAQGLEEDLEIHWLTTANQVEALRNSRPIGYWHPATLSALLAFDLKGSMLRYTNLYSKDGALSIRPAYRTVLEFRKPNLKEFLDPAALEAWL